MDYERFSKCVFDSLSVKEFYNQEVQNLKEEKVDTTRIEIDKLTNLNQIVREFDMQINCGLAFAFAEYAKEKYGEKSVKSGYLQGRYKAAFLEIDALQVKMFFAEAVAIANRNALKNISFSIREVILQNEPSNSGWKHYIVYYDTPLFRAFDKESVSPAMRTIVEQGGKPSLSMLSEQISIVEVCKMLGWSYSEYLYMLQRLKKEVSEIINFKIVKSFCNENVQNLVKNLKKEFMEWNIEGLNKSEIKMVGDCFLKNQDLLFEEQQDYYHSLVASEWFYQTFREKQVNEKTGIVSGYIKAVEQLLVVALYKKTYGKSMTSLYGSRVLIGEKDWEKKVTLGNIQYFLKDEKNKNLFPNYTIRNCFLTKLQYWIKHDRNGYFHKDNVYSLEKITDIRSHCIELYLLILTML